MKKILFFAVIATASALCGYVGYTNSHFGEPQLSDIQLANIEALAEGGEGPTVVGCKRLDGATCYVFDGNDQLVDRRKNQYPG